MNAKLNYIRTAHSVTLIDESGLVVGWHLAFHEKLQLFATVDIHDTDINLDEIIKAWVFDCKLPAKHVISE